MGEYVGELIGRSLATGEVLRSPNRLYGLIMQGDGNLVLYADGQNLTTPVWATNTWTLPLSLRPNRADMQGDGNLVLYNGVNYPSWASGTDGNPGARLVLQDDRNLVIYTGDGRPVWASGTHVAQPDTPSQRAPMKSSTSAGTSSCRPKPPCGATAC